MIIFLYVAILIGSTVMGASFSKKHQTHLNVFKELNVFANVLENQIKFKKNSLKIIVKDNLYLFSSPLNNTLSSYFISPNSYVGIYALTVQENEFLQSFLNSLGKSDSTGEINNLNFYKSEINKKLDESKENYKKLGTLGTKLGFIAGLLMIIVLL